MLESNGILQFIVKRTLYEGSNERLVSSNNISTQTDGGVAHM